MVGGSGVFFKLFFKTALLVEIHGWMGMAMFAAAVVHIAQNWVSIKSYLRDWRVLTLILPILVAVCYFVFWQKETDRGVKPRQLLVRLANGSMENVAKALGKNPDAMVQLMRQEGIKVDGFKETINETAKQNQMIPEKVFGYFFR